MVLSPEDPGRLTPQRSIVAIWGDHPPGNARATTQTYVGRLRRLLGEERIVTRPDGYLIEVSDDQLDLARFDKLVERASSVSDPAAAAGLLAEALALWRGPALADVPSDTLHRTAVPALTERRLAVLERRNELDLAAGRNADLIGELRTLTAEHPLRERFWAQLMTALANCGRQGEALQAYRDVQALLANELGVDPGADLREVYQAILRGGPRKATATDPARDAGTRRHPLPAHLPPDVAGFTGRAPHLCRLDALLTNESREPRKGPLAVVISAIEGMAGVGKTTPRAEC